MSSPRRQLLANILIAIGLLVVVGEVALHIVGVVVPSFDYEIQEFVILIAAVLGFWGFWQKDPDGTERGTRVLVDVAVRLNPFRRSTDRAAAVAPQVEARVEVIPPPPTNDTGERRREGEVG